MSSFTSRSHCIIFAAFSLAALFHKSNAALSASFYSSSCSNISAVAKEGCDASIMLDSSSTIASEQNSPSNANSIRGLNVIDNIKTALEKVCPGVVSCADIIALAAEISVNLAGGPSWSVLFGRKDGTIANQTGANTNLPGPGETVTALIAKFAAVGLNTNDMVTLSGAHTFGKARCFLITGRVYNFNGNGLPDPTLNSTYLAQLRLKCPQGGDFTTVVDLDQDTPNTFDNKYYTNLQTLNGLLTSDQELFSTPGAPTVSTVNSFASSQNSFFANFALSMIKMGNIPLPSGITGEIRSNCRKVNGS